MEDQKIPLKKFVFKDLFGIYTFQITKTAVILDDSSTRIYLFVYFITHTMNPK